MSLGSVFVGSMGLLALSACAAEEPPFEEIVVDPEATAEVVDTGPQELIPDLEQCDADDYRPMIGTPVAAATFPQSDLLRVYSVTDIVTQDYLPQRTNIVVGADGLILRVSCG